MKNEPASKSYTHYRDVFYKHCKTHFEEENIVIDNDVTKVP